MLIGRTGAEAETPELWPPDVRTDSLEKTLKLGKIESERRRGQQKMRWLDDITNSMGVGDGQGGLECFGLWDAKSWTHLSD